MIRNVIRSRNCFQWISRRTYLSEGYKCDGSWAERLETPILKKSILQLQIFLIYQLTSLLIVLVNIDNLYYDLDLKFQQQKKVSAIDLDIFANKTEELDEIADLAQKLRLSEEASKVLDSTSHALIRNYYGANQIETLIPILASRLEFGVFLDNFSANLILDQLLKEKNHKIAARIATILSLQEDFENSITNSMSLLACYKFLGQLEPFDDLKVAEPVVDAEAPKSKKKKEEIRIRVKFLRNEFFDDHFDIKNTNHLVGKTILYLADTLKDPVLKSSLQILGYGLYEKYEEANKFLADNKGSLYKEVVDFVKELGKVENLELSEAGKQFFDNLNNISKQQDGNVNDLLEKMVQEAVAERETKDIEDQKKVRLDFVLPLKFNIIP